MGYRGLRVGLAYNTKRGPSHRARDETRQDVESWVVQALSSIFNSLKDLMAASPPRPRTLFMAVVLSRLPKSGCSVALSLPVSSIIRNSGATDYA